MTELSNRGLHPIGCRTIYEANEEWENERGNIDAIVLDLMLSPIGLPNEYINKSITGKIAGWFWLWHFVIEDGNALHIAHEKKIAIYSGYLDYLDSHMISATAKEKKLFSQIKAVHKNNHESENELILYLLGDPK
jgi:hypothetical protein